MSLIYEVRDLKPGHECTARPIIQRIVAGQAEMTWFTEPIEAGERVLASIEDSHRLELCYWHRGLLVAIAVLQEDDDPHVGLCMSVQWRWVHPAYRACTTGTNLQRAIIRTAKELGHKVLAYTKTIAPGRYELTYLPLEKRRG